MEPSDDLGTRVFIAVVLLYIIYMGFAVLAVV